MVYETIRVSINILGNNHVVYHLVYTLHWGVSLLLFI